MKCLVTGGSGFVGSHVVDELIRIGQDVTIFDVSVPNFGTLSKNCKFVQGDIRNGSIVGDLISNAEIVFHFSGMLGTSELFDDPKTAIDVNIVGALNVLLAATLQPVRPRVFIPNKPNGWNNVYSVTSMAVEKLGHAYQDNFSLDLRMMRLRNVYGPRQGGHNVRKCVPDFITRALTNRNIEIFGTGRQHLELQYVTDVAGAIVAYMLNAEKINRVSETQISANIPVRKLATEIIKLTHSSSQLTSQPMRIGESVSRSRYQSKSSRIVQIGPPVTNLDIGLSKTIAWYKDDLDEMHRRR